MIHICHHTTQLLNVNHHKHEQHDLLYSVMCVVRSAMEIKSLYSMRLVCYGLGGLGHRLVQVLVLT